MIFYMGRSSPHLPILLHLSRAILLQYPARHEIVWEVSSEAYLGCIKRRFSRQTDMKVFGKLVGNTFSLPFNSSSWTIPSAPLKSSRDLRPVILSILPTVEFIGTKNKVQLPAAMLRVRRMLNWVNMINNYVSRIAPGTSVAASRFDYLTLFSKLCPTPLLVA